MHIPVLLDDIAMLISAKMIIEQLFHEFNVIEITVY